MYWCQPKGIEATLDADNADEELLDEYRLADADVDGETRLDGTVTIGEGCGVVKNNLKINSPTNSVNPEKIFRNKLLRNPEGSGATVAEGCVLISGL